MKILRSSRVFPHLTIFFLSPFFAEERHSKGEGLDAKAEQKPEGSNARAKVIR